MKRILIIEREYGCGAAEVAEQAARRLGWQLWDQQLTAEIAKMARVDPGECARREERVDSWLYRLGKIFWRGSYEPTMAIEGPEVLDADRMVELIQHVVGRIAESGQCVLVGRGAPYYLRNRSDTFCAFLYAPRDLKIRHVAAQEGTRAKAERLVDTVDLGRAAFIKHYFGKDWPNRHLYHLMVNTVIGIEATVELILRTMDAVSEDEQTRVDME